MQLLAEKRKMGTDAQKRRSGSFLSLGCGCSGSKSVCTKSTLMLLPARSVQELSSADTVATASSSYEEEEQEVKVESSANTPSFSDLLRQLGELERSVMAWGSRAPTSIERKTAEEEEEKKMMKMMNWRSGRKSGRGVEDSVVVVKETADPLGEFRRSMLHMIVEREIVDGEALRELLCQFLALNSPRYHGVILRAFAEIWDDVFAGYERTPEVIRRSYSRLRPRRLF